MTTGTLGEPYQVLSDCPHCRTEAAVLELMDPLQPACHLGVPSERRCRLCGWTVLASDEPRVPTRPLQDGRCPWCDAALSEAARGGEAPCPTCAYAPTTLELFAPTPLTDAAVARNALRRWAREEGDVDVDAFCRANMGRPCDDVVARLVAGQPVSTSFDVIAYLFPGSGGASPRDADRRRHAVVDRPPVPNPAPNRPDDPGVMHPRTPCRVLVSVMMADGALRDGEIAFVRRFLQREGLPGPTSDELRVWRPAELGPPPPAPLRDRLIEAAVHLAHLDHERDGSEWKVIRAFAVAWGVDREQLDAWDAAYDRRYATTMTRLWRSLSRLVRS